VVADISSYLSPFAGISRIRFKRSEALFDVIERSRPLSPIGRAPAGTYPG